MKYIVYIFIALFLVSAAKSQTLTSSLILPPSPSPYLSDWQSGREHIDLTLSLVSASAVAIRITAKLERNGEVVAQTKASAPIIRTLRPGSTTINIADLLLLSSIEFISTDADAARKTGKLPDGSYHLCFHAELIGSTNLPSDACGSFQIIPESQITLISPADGSQIRPDLPVVFQWSPASSGTSEVILFPASAGDLSHASSDKIITIPASGNGAIWIPQNTPGKTTDFWKKDSLWMWQVTTPTGTPSPRYELKIIPVLPSTTSTTSGEKTVTGKPNEPEILIFQGPCDSLKFRTAEYQHLIDSIKSAMTSATDMLAQSNARISSLKQQFQTADSLAKYYHKMKMQIWKKVMSTPVDGVSYYGPDDNADYRQAKAMEAKYTKIAQQYKDSLYQEDRAQYDKSWQYTISAMRNEIDRLTHSIAILKKDCDEYIHDQTLEQTRIEDIITSSRNCIERMKQSLASAKKKLDSLKTLPQSSWRDDAILNMSAGIARMEQAIANAQRSLDNAIAENSNGNPGFLMGLSICKDADYAESQLTMAERYANDDMKAKAENERIEKAKRDSIKFAREQEERRIEKEKEEEQRKAQEMQAVKDHLQNTFEQMIDALEKLGEHSQALQFLNMLKKGLDEIMTVVDFINFLQSIPQNYLNLLQQYALCLNNPNFANIQQLALAFCQYAGITNAESMALISQNFHTYLPGIIGNMSSQDKQDMIHTINTIIAGAGKK